MKVHGLGRGLCFALLAGLGCLPWQLVWARHAGYTGAFGSYMLLLTVAALLWCAPSLRRGLAAAALGGLVLLPLALLGPAPSSALFAGLCMLGVGRSGVAYPRPLARALAVELSLGFAASCLALLLYDASLFGTALASWSFWLVQSVYSLVPGRVGASPQVAADPFERARVAAEQLMQQR